MAMTVLRWYSFVECIERCRVVPGRTASTFVSLRVHLNWAVLLMIDAVWGRNQLTLNYAIHYNGIDGSALIFVGWIYGTGAVLDKQAVRLHCCVRLNLNVLLFAFDPVRYKVVISPSCVVQIHYIIMAITALRWSSLVECMERVLCWPWINSAYVAFLCVCLHWAVLSVIDAVWGRNFTLMRYFAVRWQWRLCIDLRLLNVWNNGCRIGPKPTDRTFVLLCVLELEGVSH